MHYVDEGDGIPVLMLHGNPTWSYLYRNVIKRLQDRCRRIAVDYPGFGYSQHPPNYGYTPEEHAEWIRALLDELKLSNLVLVMQDWGGPIGLSLALDNPDQISGLVLCNTWCWKPDIRFLIFSYLVGGSPGRFLHRRYNTFARYILPTAISQRDKLTPQLRRAYTDPFPTPDSRTGTGVFPRAIRTSSDWLETLRKSLEDLEDKPVEMVWGMKDPAFGKESYIKRWKEHFPRAHVTRLDDASHYLQEDRPDAVAEGVKRVLNKIGH